MLRFKGVLFLISAIAPSAVLPACTTQHAVSMAVRDTDGIKECATAQTQAELLAMRLKERYGPETDERSEAARSFNAAADSVSGFCKSVIDEIDVDAKVDVSRQDFQASDAAQKLDGFKSLATELMGSGITPEATLAKGVAEFVVELITRINGENDKAVKAALGRIRGVLQGKAKPLSFEEITRESIQARYASPSQK